MMKFELMLWFCLVLGGLFGVGVFFGLLLLLGVCGSGMLKKCWKNFDMLLLLKLGGSMLCGLFVGMLVVVWMFMMVGLIFLIRLVKLGRFVVGGVIVIVVCGMSGR